MNLEPLRGLLHCEVSLDQHRDGGGGRTDPQPLATLQRAANVLKTLIGAAPLHQTPTSLAKCDYFKRPDSILGSYRDRRFGVFSRPDRVTQIPVQVPLS